MRLRFTVRSLRKQLADAAMDLAAYKLMLRANGHEHCAPLAECELYLQRLAAFQEQAAKHRLSLTPWGNGSTALEHFAPAKNGCWSVTRPKKEMP